MESETSRWLAYRHEVPGARLRLFCLGGGGASMFGLWDLGMPAGVEVCPLQHPGRENRLGEPPMTRISRIADTLSEELAPWLDQQFALFGHSAGALGVFELARKLRQQGRRPPEWLFVSGHPAPHLAYRRPAASHLAPPEFWRAMQDHFDIDPALLANEGLKDMLYPALRADYELEETYKYVAEPPLDVPLTVFGGSRDLETTEAELLAWRQHTTHRFRSRILEGNHMFLAPQREALVAELAHDLSQLLGASVR